jgi:hypothetical protein
MNTRFCIVLWVAIFTLPVSTAVAQDSPTNAGAALKIYGWFTGSGERAWFGIEGELNRRWCKPDKLPNALDPKTHVKHKACRIFPDMRDPTRGGRLMVRPEQWAQVRSVAYRVRDYTKKRTVDPTHWHMKDPADVAVLNGKKHGLWLEVDVHLPGQTRVIYKRTKLCEFGRYDQGKRVGVWVRWEKCTHYYTRKDISNGWKAGRSDRGVKIHVAAHPNDKTRTNIDNNGVSPSVKTLFDRARRIYLFRQLPTPVNVTDYGDGSARKQIAPATFVTNAINALQEKHFQDSFKKALTCVNGPYWHYLFRKRAFRPTTVINPPLEDMKLKFRKYSVSSSIGRCMPNLRGKELERTLGTFGSLCKEGNAKACLHLEEYNSRQSDKKGKAFVRKLKGLCKKKTTEKSLRIAACRTLVGHLDGRGKKAMTKKLCALGEPFTCAQLAWSAYMNRKHKAANKFYAAACKHGMRRMCDRDSKADTKAFNSRVQDKLRENNRSFMKKLSRRCRQCMSLWRRKCGRTRGTSTCDNIVNNNCARVCD